MIIRQLQDQALAGFFNFSAPRMLRIGQHGFHPLNHRINAALLHVNANPAGAFGQLPDPKLFKQLAGQIARLFRMMRHPFMRQIQSALQHILMKIIFQHSAQHFAGQMIHLRIFNPLHAVALNKAPDLLLSDEFKNFRHCLLDDISHLLVVVRIGQPFAGRQR